MTNDDFRFLLASQGGERDGMLVEVQRIQPAERVAEVFEDDETGELTFTAYHCDQIPLEIIEDLLQRAHREFPSPHLRQPRTEQENI